MLVIKNQNQQNHRRLFLKLVIHGPLRDKNAETFKQHSGIFITFVNSKFPIILFQTGNIKALSKITPSSYINTTCTLLLQVLMFAFQSFEIYLSPATSHEKTAGYHTKMDKANIMLAATLDPSITHLLQVFILHLGL